MRTTVTFLLILLCSLYGYPIETTPEKEVWPESPQAAKMRHITMPTPALATGASELSVPIYDLEVEGLTIPISLAYKSNGIKVSEDPFPIGYGWTLLPPLRITRIIQGRPDEKYPFVGDKNISEFSHGIMHRCMNDLDNSNRWLDSERDLFTFHLIDKTFSAILDNGQFKTAGYEEYRIETDSLLEAIKVTDAYGRCYNFATKGERTDHNYTIEWLLSGIALPNGKNIDFSWVDAYHGNPYQISLQPTIMSYGIDRNKPSEQHTEWTSAKTRLYECAKNLKQIDFPGGKIVLSYTGKPKFREITSLNVLWGSDTVKTVGFKHRGNYNCLLEKVILSDDGIYTFEYQENESANTLAQDFWGFYNGKSVAGEFAPTMSLSNIGWRNNSFIIGGTDRSPDEQYAQNFILKKAQFPTGGTLEWEYELHRFKEVKTYGGATGIKYASPEHIDKGGGLRVKKMTLKSSESEAGQITEYEYGVNGDGLANVIGIPTHETFLSSLEWIHTYDAWDASCQCYITDLEHDGLVFASQSSNWLDYQHGATPIWYSEVTEKHLEGKIVHKFKNCDENIIFHEGNDEFWKVIPVTINTAFSRGPVEYERITYAGLGNNFSKAETKYWNYGSFTTSLPIYNNVFIQRKKIQTELPTVPDFDEDNCVEFNRKGVDIADLPLPYCYEYDNIYEAYHYDIRPQREVLLWEQATEHTTTGDISRKIVYEYEPQTDLLRSISTTVGSHTYVKLFEYAKSDGGIAQSQMVERNIIGEVVKTTEKYDGTEVTETAEMAAFGSSIKPSRFIRQRNGGQAYSAMKYNYSPFGKLVSATDSAGIVTSWAWGHNDRYPISMSIGSALVSTATWQPLVGLTSLEAPNGTKHYYNYDNAGRLIEQGTNGQKTVSYEYHISQNGNNYILTKKWTSPTTFASERINYDGLGRPESSITNERWGTFTTYDQMGRESEQWVPAQISNIERPQYSDFIVMSSTMHADQHPYSGIEYEASPRQIVKNVRKAGDAWFAENKSKKYSIYANDTKKYSCQRYVINEDGVKLNGIHSPGDLKVLESIDEDGVSP